MNPTDLFPDEAVGVKIYLEGGPVLEWPVDEDQRVRFEIPLALFRVITAEVEVIEEQAPRIPGDARPRQVKKLERQIVRTSDVVNWTKVIRMEYIFAKRPESVVQEEEAEQHPTAVPVH